MQKERCLFDVPSRSQLKVQQKQLQYKLVRGKVKTQSHL